MAKLTKKSIDAAVPASAPFFMWDSELPGFGIRGFPTGRRVYYADYRTKSGTRRRMSLGAHGKLTVDEARKLAIVTLGDVIRGEDPAEERSTRRNSLRVTELCDNYIAAAEKGLILGKRGAAKKASTLYVDRGRIERHVKPLLGNRLVKDLTPVDIQRFVRDVTSGKTAADVKTGKRGRAIVEGGAGTAARTVGLLGGILSYAVSEGVIAHNPATGVKKPADKKRDRRLNAEEYRALGRVLTQAELDRESWQGIAGLRLLALTGCRLGEIEKLLWSAVDLENGALRLDDSKEGRSIRPLGEAAQRVLSRLQRGQPNTFVLTAARSHDGAFGSMPAAIERYMKRAALSSVTAHTLRHSFASVAADLGYSDTTIGAMLGHAGSTVTSRYVHHLDTVLTAAATRVAENIARELGC